MTRLRVLRVAVRDVPVFTSGIRLSELAGIRHNPGDPARSDLDLRARARHPQAWRSQLWLGVNSRGPLTATGIYQIIARRGRQAGEDGSVAPIIGGLPAVEGSAWDIGAPLDERRAGLAAELGSPQASPVARTHEAESRLAADRSGHDSAPAACAREGVPWPARRSPHGEGRIMAPAGRYSMKAVVRPGGH
jgi:hypothetical protein